MRRQTQGRPPHRYERVKVSATDEAIAAFRRDQPGYSERTGIVRDINQALFRGFTANMEQPDKQAFVGKNVERRVAEILKNKRQTKQFANQFNKLAGAIWDGVKRLTRWLYRMFRSVVSKTRELLANLARYIALNARQFFGYITSAVDIVQGGSITCDTMLRKPVSTGLLFLPMITILTSDV